MKAVCIVAPLLAMAFACAPVLAQVDPHSSHHPTAAAATPAAPPADASTADASHDLARMDAQMKNMHDMHSRMMAAKTPAEREALMAQHMKAMQDGMGMMNAMFPGDTADMKGMKDMSAGGMGNMKGDMAQRHRMMEKRMDMMQAMMQMMMDRLPAPPAK